MKKDLSGPPLEIGVGILVHGDRVLVARRPEGSHLAGTWEFPGGKVRPGEPVEETVSRELEEETGVAISRPRLLHVEEHRYPDRFVRLSFYLCAPSNPQEEPRGRDGQELRWVRTSELRELETPAGNRRVIEMLVEQLGGE